MYLLPLLLITSSLAAIVACGYWSRFSRENKYAMPSDRGARSMLAFLRKLDGDFEPQRSFLRESNLPAIHEAVQKASAELDQDNAGLSRAELREAQFYRLRFGYLAMLLRGNRSADQGEWEDLLDKTRLFVSEATQVSAKESQVAMYAMKALEIEGRTTEAIELAKRIESKFSSLPDGPSKTDALNGIAGIYSRLKLLGAELELETKTLQGQSFEIASLRGKVVFVDFYTTTCGHCIADLPALKRIYRMYHGKGFEILSICLHEKPSKMESFVRDYQLPWIHICHHLVDGNDALAEKFSISSVPTTMLIDQSGRVIQLGVRPLSPPNAIDRDLEENLKRLLPHSSHN